MSRTWVLAHLDGLRLFPDIYSVNTYVSFHFPPALCTLHESAT